MLDIYYNPEKFGLTPVGEIEWSEPCYSFDTTAVWKDEQGNFLWASDSGCSCPTPFDGYGIDDCEKGNAHECAAALQTLLSERTYDQDYAEPQVVDLISRLMSA